MPMDQARIGGIGIGDSIDYVKSIYGEPTYVGQRGKNYLYDGLYAYDMTYGDSFKLSVVENSMAQKKSLILLPLPITD